ncbi:MAG: hypothetical protein JNK36_00285 [Bacteroidia bacterium]|nr:hypothetical protein [Bacteroidia bacterium]MBP7713489.1 hypothetical protein [Bacteroidia bacterium]MBP8667331.1 hypothetical protein [Bacteroidia bacterium]QQR96448.1 MAG: hypothetical protein IPJ93_07580 [Bacteroidota bacterium]
MRENILKQKNEMKNLKLNGFEIYLLQESLKHYKTLVANEEFPKNSVVTKEYVEMMIAQLEEKLGEKTIKERVRELNATS